MDTTVFGPPCRPVRDAIQEWHYGVGVAQFEDEILVWTEDPRQALAAALAATRRCGGERPITTLADVRESVRLVTVATRWDEDDGWALVTATPGQPSAVRLTSVSYVDRSWPTVDGVPVGCINEPWWLNTEGPLWPTIAGVPLTVGRISGAGIPTCCGERMTLVSPLKDPTWREYSCDECSMYVTINGGVVLDILEDPL